MAAEPTSGRAGPERPVLARLVGSDTDGFADRVWGQAPWLSHADGRGFQDLLDEGGVDELLSGRGLRTPFVRLAQDGTTLSDRSFTAGGGVGAGIADQVDEDKVHRLFADGATVVLQGLHRVWAPLVSFTQELAAELGHPVQANAYITPPESTGFAAHYDVHDVFVAQAFGRKRWKVHEPVRRWPDRDEPWTQRRAEVDAAARRPPVLDTVLGPGDCLYLPRGYLHSARALGEVSAHVTIGVHTWTEHAVSAALLRAALRAVTTPEAGRAPLPLGVDVGDPAAVAEVVERARVALADAVRAVGPAQVAADLESQARQAQRPAPLAPLSQAAAAREVALDRGVVLRSHLRARAEAGQDGAVVLTSRAGSVTIPATEAAGLPDILDGSPLSVEDLALPEDHAVSLVRRLLAAGVIVPL